jgi:hypothetical protein
MRRARWISYLGLLLVVCLIAGDLTDTTAEPRKVRGQTLLVPAYSEIPYGDRGLTLPLTITVTVRNVDRQNALTLRRVQYFASNGSLLRSYLGEPSPLPPLASVHYMVKQSDLSGGVTPSFLIDWDSGTPVWPPIVEAVMIGAVSAQGISFHIPARVVSEQE